MGDEFTAKERTESPALEERRGTGSPSGFQKETPLLRTPGSQAFHLQTCARMHFSCFLVIFKETNTPSLLISRPILEKAPAWGQGPGSWPTSTGEPQASPQLFALSLSNDILMAVWRINLVASTVPSSSLIWWFTNLGGRKED